MEKAHNVLLKFPVMLAISKWPILMRPPRVIRKLMVSQMISLCLLIILLHVGSACDYCLTGISSSTSHIRNNGKQWKVWLTNTACPGLCPHLLPGQPAELMFTLALQPPSWGQQKPASCLKLVPTYFSPPARVLPLLLNGSSKRLGWLLWLAHRALISQSTWAQRE